MSTVEPPVEELVRRLGALVEQRRWRLSVAESCTGGLLGAALTSVSGSSSWFECGFVTYSNRSKQRALGVDATVLSRYGAVSPEVAAEMAEGALAHSGADLAISITGVAGPGGGTASKPVGMVCFGWKHNGESVHAASCHFSGDREAVRMQAVRYAVSQLITSLEEQV